MRDAGEPWWSTFFDERYTEAWQAAGAFAGTDVLVDGVVDLLQLRAGERVLDVPCGFGRVAGPLAARGIDVVGIDASADQLRIARERNPGAEYVLGDMRQPPAGCFDAVLNLYSSFGYFDDAADDTAALRAWRAVLRPGGRLLMELNHRDRIAHLHGTAAPVADGPVRERPVVDWVSGIVTSTVTWVDDPAMETRTFRVRLYTVTELVALVRAAGFVDIAAFGDVDRRPVTPDTRLVLVARAGAAPHAHGP